MLILLFVYGTIALATEQNLESRIQQLELQLQDLQRKQTPTSFGFKMLTDNDKLRTQLGPVASKIYFSQGGAWEAGLSSELFTYQNKDDDRMNVLSVSPALAFRPHRRLIFNSQFLFENGGSESRNTVAYQKGQAIVQFAYLDWLATEAGSAGIRVGHQLLPVGWTNTLNEPVTFLSVLKPEVERVLIPGSWHENGVSLWMDRPRIDIQMGVFNSLDARGFRGETFIAGGRSQGQNAAATDLMAVMRINAKSEQVLVGASLWAGNTAQKDSALGNSTLRMGEVHGRLRLSRFELLGLAVQGQLDDAESISVYNGTTMASQANGSYIQAAFNALEGPQSLWLFARQEEYNLNARMASGYSANPAVYKTITSIGASYLPLPNLVLKADYSSQKNGYSQRANEISLGVGAVF